MNELCDRCPDGEERPALWKAVTLRLENLIVSSNWENLCDEHKDEKAAEPVTTDYKHVFWWQDGREEHWYGQGATHRDKPVLIGEPVDRRKENKDDGK